MNIEEQELQADAALYDPNADEKFIELADADDALLELARELDGEA